jgi:hypothetical protein
LLNDADWIIHVRAGKVQNNAGISPARARKKAAENDPIDAVLACLIKKTGNAV